MQPIEFVVLMDPVAKGRPRFWKGRVLTDRKTRAFEKAFKLAAAKHRPAQPIDGPVQVSLLFQVKKPKSVKREYPSVKPDVDNFAKAALDALSDFWKDDSQIIRLYARKRYGLIPLIKVEIGGPSSDTITPESHYTHEDSLGEGKERVT